MPSSTALLGAAGEYYVMSELLRRGFVAALAPQGVPELDIVVADAFGESLCGLQVKTRSGKGGDGGWHMRPIHGTIRRDRIFYCFVDFGSSEAERPAAYVVPSSVVADAIENSHVAWLSSPGKGGRQRQDSSVRRFLPDYDYAFRPKENPYPEGWLKPYLNAWDWLRTVKEAKR
jgi:hypothetical protein